MQNLFVSGVWIAGFRLLLTLFNFHLLHHTKQQTAARKSTKRGESFWKALRVPESAKYALIAGSTFGITAGLLVGLGGEDIATVFSFGLELGIFVGLSVLLIGYLLQQVPTTIEPAEVLLWSRKSLWRSLSNRAHVKKSMKIGLGTMVLVGLSTWLVGFLDGWHDTGVSGAVRVALRYGLSFGLSVGLSVIGSYWLLVGLFQGISYTSVQQQRIAPNEGIKRSAHNGVLLGLIGGLTIAFASGMSIFVTDVLHLWLNDQVIYWFGDGLVYYIGSGLSCGSGCWPAFGVSDGLGRGPLIGLFGGLLVVMVCGGLTWWRHWLLRLLLWRGGTIPWHYVSMLDEASRCILLRKEGGGYRFIHDLFRDYLASLSARKPSVSPSPKNGLH